MVLFKVLRRRLRNFVFASPSVYSFIGAVKGNKYRVVKSSELVIEGFPRSANTFVEAALRLSQPQIKHFSHHTHAPANVLKALSLHKNTVIVIRNPIDAVASFLEMEDGFDPSVLLSEYIEFYTKIPTDDKRIFIVRFDHLYADLQELPEVMNRSSGVQLNSIFFDNDFIKACYSHIDDLNRIRNAGGADRYSPFQDGQHKIARQKRLKKIREELLSESLRLLRDEAIEVYCRFVSAHLARSS